MLRFSSKMRGHRLSFAPVALAAILAMAAAPTASAASYVGTGYAAAVTCDETGNFMDITPAAWPAAGLSTQWVRYSVAIWDASRNRPFSGYWPSNWSAPFNVGTFRTQYSGYVLTNFVSQPGQALRVYVPDGSYTVQTLYSFYYLGQWFNSPSWIATTAYKTAFYNWSNSVCRI
jgi:hypothetical protein